LKIILVGFGFIGRSFVKALREKNSAIREAFPDFKLIGVSDIDGYLLDENGLDLEILSKIRKVYEYPGKLVQGSSVELIEKSGADALIEATPTNIANGEPGLSHILKALELGMHVVTSNKGPFVVAFRKIMDLAERSGVNVMYEATVGGAIPIFSLKRWCLRGVGIRRIRGILNGTTNYILSKMHFDEVGFENALKEAREKGLAEADPSYDVDGIDAGCKVVILANSILGKNITIKDVEMKGIRGISLEEVIEAKRNGKAIKLIAEIGEKFQVKPEAIPLNSPFCVHGSLNVIHLETDLAGDLMLIGHGAGKETAAAMLNDLLSLPAPR